MDNFPSISTGISNSSFDLSGVLWIILGIGALIFAISSITLVYHWIKYGLNAHKMVFVMFSYFIVGGLLLIIATASAGYYQLAM